MITNATSSRSNRKERKLCVFSSSKQITSKWGECEEISFWWFPFSMRYHICITLFDWSVFIHRRCDSDGVERWKKKKKTAAAAEVKAFNRDLNHPFLNFRFNFLECIRMDSSVQYPFNVQCYQMSNLLIAKTISVFLLLLLLLPSTSLHSILIP